MGHTNSISHSRTAREVQNMPYKIEKSEGVAHTEVQGCILQSQVVNPPLTDRTVGVVELNTPVEAEYGKFDVETDTETGVEAELLVEVVDVEDSIIGVLGGVGLHVPDVT